MATAILKRTFDLVVAGLMLLVLALPMLLVALAIRICMGSPVVFHQRRPGRHERPFEIHKFRTMTDARGPDGNLLPDARRLTRLGRFLRQTSLDELPQLWNVLAGEMSFVGPRPLLLRYLPYYTKRERIRFAVLPGITGWAQIHGRNEVLWDKRLALDAWYVENHSLWLDCRILLLTLIKVIKREGTVVDAQAAGLDLDEERSLAA
jgi:sugar transferase EpsL